MTSIGGQTPTYDQNGDVTNDFLNSYSWDANGGPVTVDGVGVTYDALGRIAEADKSGTYYETVYSPAGGKLAVMSGQSLNFALVPLAGGAVAEYHGGGVLYYRHADWLGSGRFVSTTSRTTYADQAYGPFGEPYAGSGTSDLMFTGMDQDTTGNVYDFPEREYGIQGRWPSPDPVGLASVDPTDPQTWNRYAYLRNSPLEGTDPTGTDDCWGMPNGEVNQGTAEYVQCEEEQMFGNSATGNLGSASGSSSDSPLSTENQFQSNYFSASYNGPVYTSATWGAAGITSPNDFIAYGTELTVVGIDDIAYTVKSYFGSCAPSGATLSNSCNAGYQFGKDLGFGESAWEKYVNTVSGSNGQVPKPGTLPAPAFPNTPGLTVPAPLKPTCSVPNVMKLWLQQLKAWLTNNRDSQLPLEFQQPPAWVVSCATPRRPEGVDQTVLRWESFKGGILGTRCARVAPLIFTVLLAPIAVSPQTERPSPPDAQRGAPAPIRVESNMVVVPVFVFDRRQIQRRTPESCDYADDKAFFNAPLSQPYLPRTAKDCWWGDIRGLSAANFRLFQNGIEQKIERVTSERWTITVRDNKTYHAQYSITPAAIWSTTDLGGYSGIFYGPGPDILLYELSYVPTVLGSGCHRIDVTVDALDAKVFAPERYCTGETPTDPLNGTPYGDQLASHLMTDKSGQIPLSLQTGFVYTDEKAARIDVALAFPWDRLNHEWYESNWTLRARTGIVGLVSGENGMYSGSFSDLLYPSYWPMFMFGRGDWEREYRLGSGFPADPMLVESLLKKQDPAFLPSRYETQLDLRPGQYDLRVVLSDEKKFGRASARLDIPEYDGKQLALSSVILCKRYRDAHAAAVERAAASFAPQYVPLVSKGVEFTPAGDTTFTKGADPLIAYFEVYEPLLVAHPKTQVEIHIRIVNGATGQVVKDFPTVDAATYIEAGKTAIHIARKIPFDKLAKGQYRLEVQATDSAGRSTPWQSADFTVVNEAKH